MNELNEIGEAMASERGRPRSDAIGLEVVRLLMRRTQINCTLISPDLRHIFFGFGAENPRRVRLKCRFEKWSRKSPPVFHPVTRGCCVHPKWQPLFGIFRQTETA
jgi:hypothetical protein